MNKEEKTPDERLKAILKHLRDPKTGCPWDLEQTHETLKPFIIEEAYEVIDSIENDPSKLKEELGDILLQVCLHSQIASERNDFDLDAVCEALANPPRTEDYDT